MARRTAISSLSRRLRSTIFSVCTPPRLLSHNSIRSHTNRSEVSICPWPRIFSSHSIRSLTNRAGAFIRPPPPFGFYTKESISSYMDRSEVPIMDKALIDYEHWFVTMKEPGGEGATEEQIKDCYIKTLAKVVGSEEEAKARIYDMNCDRTMGDMGFYCKLEWEKSIDIGGVDGVSCVLMGYNPDPNYKDTVTSIREEEVPMKI